MSKTTITHTSRLLKPEADRKLIAELEAAAAAMQSPLTLDRDMFIETTSVDGLVSPVKKPGIGDVTFKELMFGHPKSKQIVAARLILYVLLVIPAFFLGKQQDQS